MIPPSGFAESLISGHQRQLTSKRRSEVPARPCASGAAAPSCSATEPQRPQRATTARLDATDATAEWLDATWLYEAMEPRIRFMVLVDATMATWMATIEL